MSVPNPLKAVLEGKRNVLFDEEPQVQIGDDDSHLILYPEINPEDKSKAPETLTDTNTVYVSNSAGNNANPGTSASPKKTVNSAITKAGTSDAYKYICLKANTYIYVEDIHLPVNLTVYNDTGVSSSIRMIMRDIPATMNDANTKWVDVNSGDDSTGSGTRAAPYKTVNKAINDISTNAFLYVAVLIDDTHYQSTENICWIPGSSVTQTVKIVPYMDELSGSEMKPGKTLELLPDTSQDLTTLNYFSNKKHSATFVSRRFSSTNKLKFFNFWERVLGTNTSDLEYLEDFNTVSSVGATGDSYLNYSICEYYYNDHWYILTFGRDIIGGGDTAVQWFKDDFATKNTYILSNDCEGAVCSSDGSFVVLATDSYAYILGSNKSPTNSGNWEELMSFGSGNTRYINILEDNRVMISCYPNGEVFTYYNGEVSEYEFGVVFNCFFSNDNKIYGVRYNTDSGYNVISQIDLSSSTYTDVYTIPNQGVGIKRMSLANYEGITYLIAKFNTIGGNYYVELWRFKDEEDIEKIGSYTSASLEMNERPGTWYVFNGILPITMYNTTTTNLYCFNVSQYAAFGKSNTSGVKFINDYFGSCISAMQGQIEYCRFEDAHIGYENQNNSNNKLQKSIFKNCNYGLFVNTSIGHSIEYCLLYNFITGIYYKAQTNSTSAYDCEMKFITADLGTTFYKANARTVTAGSQSSITASIISRIGYPVNSEESIDVDVDYTILPTGGSYTGENIEDTCVIAQPVFRNRDASPPDYRLQKKWIVASNGIAYLFDSPGIDFYNDSGTDYDAGCYRFDRDLYHNIWDYEWQCDFNPSAVAIAQSFQNMSEFISVSGIKLPTHYGEPNRLVIPWIPKTATEMRTLRNLYAIIRRLEKARLTLNPWDDYSETDLENLAQAGDLGIFSGPSAIGGGASIIATFYPDDMKLVQSENTFIEDEFKGWLVYINYDDSGTRKGFYLKITSNDETTLYLKDVDGLDTIPSSAIDNQSDEMIYIIGAMYVRCNTQALESNLSIWYRNSGPVMGTIDIEFIEA